MSGTRPKLAILVAALMTAALIAAPSAGAGTAKADAFSLGFDGVYKAGKPVKVKNFVYSNLPLTCTEGSTTYSTPKKFPKMKLNEKLKFKGTLVAGGVTSKVVGKYKRNLSKITGTLKATGDTNGFTNCKSGKIRWKAV